jgi:hypothetical protein
VVSPFSVILSAGSLAVCSALITRRTERVSAILYKQAGSIRQT